VIGSFPVVAIIRNDGSLPKLRSLENKLSEWQFKPDVWVAQCGRILWLKEKIYFPGFRGWRYFDLAKYRGTLDAKVRI